MYFIFSTYIHTHTANNYRSYHKTIHKIQHIIISYYTKRKVEEISEAIKGRTNDCRAGVLHPC